MGMEERLDEIDAALVRELSLNADKVNAALRGHQKSIESALESIPESIAEAEGELGKLIGDLSGEEIVKAAQQRKNLKLLLEHCKRERIKLQYL